MGVTLVKLLGDQFSGTVFVNHNSSQQFISPYIGLQAAQKLTARISDRITSNGWNIKGLQGKCGGNDSIKYRQERFRLN